jgi:hypothetical protein
MKLYILRHRPNLSMEKGFKKSSLRFIGLTSTYTNLRTSSYAESHKEISVLLLNTKVQHRVHNSPLSFPVLSHMNQA